MMTTFSHAKAAAGALPAWLLENKIVKMALAEKEKEIDTERQVLAKALTEAHQELARFHGEEEKDMAAAKSEMEAIEEKKKEILATHHTTLTKIRQDYAKVSRDISALEMSLRQSSDPAIIETIQFFRERLDILMNPQAIRRSVFRGLKNPVNFKREVSITSNETALHSAIDYCKSAISGLESMRLLSKCDFGKIEKLRKGIPSVSEFTVAEFYGQSFEE